MYRGWMMRARKLLPKRSYSVACSLVPLLCSLQADAIRVKVGFPISPDTRDAKAMARYYNLVKIDENKFFDNIISAAYVFSSPS